MLHSASRPPLYGCLSPVCQNSVLCKQELLSCFPFPFLFSSGLLPRSTACLSGGFLWNTNKIVLWLSLETVLKFFFLMRWRTPWRNHSISDIKKGEFAFVKKQLVILEFKRPSEKDPGLAWAIKLEANLGYKTRTYLNQNNPRYIS